MVQEIITYVIVAGAFSFVALKIVRLFFPGREKTKSKNCGSCSAECVLRDSVIATKDKCPSEKETVKVL